MIEQELILLGLLRQSPKHGYEIKVQAREILSFFAGVRLKSIYYPLRILEKKGLLSKQANKPARQCLPAGKAGFGYPHSQSHKSGSRPKRLVYCLTEKGKKRFEILLNNCLLYTSPSPRD